MSVNLLNSPADSKLYNLFTRYGRWLTIGVMAFLGLIGFTFYQTQNKQQSREQGYLAAPSLIKQLEIAALKQKADLFEESLFQLQKTLSLLPDLEGKYDGILAQDLLLGHQGTHAAIYGSHALERTQALLPPLYHQFSKTSLLIGQGLYQEALLATQKIEGDLLAAAQDAYYNAEELSVLYAMTLVRQATLHQTLGLVDKELEAWGKIKDLMEGDLNLPFSCESARLWLAEHFSYGSLSLLDYIQFRQSTALVG